MQGNPKHVSAKNKKKHWQKPRPIASTPMSRPVSGPAVRAERKGITRSSDSERSMASSGDGEAKRRKRSRLHRPPGMSLEDWQIELRRQFGREQDYQFHNRGE